MLPKIQAQNMQQDRMQTRNFSPNNRQNNSQNHMEMNQNNSNNMNNTNGNMLNSTNGIQTNQNMLYGASGNMNNSTQYINQNNSIEDFSKYKESSWDTRHHVKAGLPQYDAYQDKYSESYQLSQAIHTQNGRLKKDHLQKQQKIQNNNLQNSYDGRQTTIYQDDVEGSPNNFKKKGVQSSQRNRSLTYKRIKDPKVLVNNGNISTTSNKNQNYNAAYNQFGMESLQEGQQQQKDTVKTKRVQTQKEKVEDLYQQLLGLYDTHNIQHFHREYFDLFVQDMPSKRLFDILSREIKLINEKKSLYQITVKTIRARENCLEKLKDALFSLSDCYDKKDKQIEESYFDNCCRLLAHLRILTISTAESISQWRNYFFFIQKYATGYEKYKKKDIMLIFFWEHMNYMLKIRSDAHFANNSVMNKYIPFSSKYDPFFVYPNKLRGDFSQFSQFSPKIQESINGFLELSDHLKSRIQNCEKIIINECLMDKANKRLHPVGKDLLLDNTPKYLKNKQISPQSNSFLNYEKNRIGNGYNNSACHGRHASHNPRRQIESDDEYTSLRADRSANDFRSNSRAGLNSSRKSVSANKRTTISQDKYLMYSENKNENLNNSEKRNYQSRKNINNQSMSLSNIKNYGFEQDNRSNANVQSFNQTFSPNKIQYDRNNSKLQTRQSSHFNLDNMSPSDVNISKKNIQKMKDSYYQNSPYLDHPTISSPIKTQQTFSSSPNQKRLLTQQNLQYERDEDGINYTQSSQKNLTAYANNRETNRFKQGAAAQNPTSQTKRATSLNPQNQTLKQMAQNQKSKIKNQASGINSYKNSAYNKSLGLSNGRKRTFSGNQNDTVKMNVQEIGVAISEYIENKLKEPRQKQYFVKPRSIMERELKVTLKDYFLRIPNILYKLLVNDENNLINKLKDEINFHLLEIREQQSERIAALCILHIDRQVISCRRIEIDHFSVIELENFDPILKKLIEFIWSNDQVDEISFRISCNQQPEELNPFHSIQEILFDNHFKWREVETSDDADNYNEDMGINNSSRYHNPEKTIKVFYVQRPNSKPKIKLPNLKYVENHVLTVKQSVIISKEPLDMEDHVKTMNLQYLEQPAKYVDVTMIIIAMLVQVFTQENLQDLANVKTNKKVKEAFNLASRLYSNQNNQSDIESIARQSAVHNIPNHVIENNLSFNQSFNNNVNQNQSIIKTNQNNNIINSNNNDLAQSKNNNVFVQFKNQHIDVDQNQNNENNEKIEKHEKNEQQLQKRQSLPQVQLNQKNQNNFLLTSGVLKTEEFPKIEGLNKYLVGLNQNVFLLKDPPVFKKNKVNLGFLQHGFHLPNFHQSVLQIVGDKLSYYLRIRITEDLQGLCWKLRSSSVYGDHELLLIPTEDFNNFMFFLDAREYLAKDNPPDLFLFLRKFLESVDDKQQVEGDIWIPQFKKKCILIKNTDMSSIFAEKKIYTNLETSLVFRDQIDGGKMILNDLEENTFLVKAPFIFGMLHNELDALIQNIPFYSFIVDEDDLDIVQDKNSYHRKINTNIHPSLLSLNPTQSQIRKMGTQDMYK